MLSGDNSILQKATDANERTSEAQIKEEISLAWNGVQTEGILNGWETSQKATSLQTELKKEDSSAIAKASGSTITVKYKGYKAVINEANGSLTSFAKASGEEDPVALTVGQAYEDVLIKIGDKFKYTGDTQTEWIVFGKDDKDNVLLTTKSAVQDKKFTLSRDPQHWLSYETDLHTHCANLYGNASKGITARSITLEDINRVTGYTEPALNPYTFGAEQKYEERKVNYYYPTTETATATTKPYLKKATGTADSKTFTETHEPYSYSNLDVSNQNAKYVLGGYWDAGHENEGTDSEYYHPYEDYVVASRSVYVLSDGAYFRNARVDDGYVYSGYGDFLYTYEWGTAGGPPISVSVRPIVVISPDILVFEGLDGVYEVVE